MRPAECAASSVVRVTGLARSYVKGCVSSNVNRKHCGVFHESCRCFVFSLDTSDSEKHNSCYRQKVFDDLRHADGDQQCGWRPMWA